VWGFRPGGTAWRAGIGEGLREGGRQGGPAGSRRTRDGLVAAEVALALVLLTGAGLLLRTLWGMQTVDRGFRPAHVAMATVSLPGAAYRTPEEIRERGLPDSLAERLAHGV